MSPQRIQRKRTKGWRMPPGAVYVGRPTRWGNPFPAGDDSPFSRDEAARMYREVIEAGVTWWPDLVGTPHETRHRFTWPSTYPSVRRPIAAPTVAEIREHLAGRDLACWCPTDAACHGDVLLRLANGSES